MQDTVVVAVGIDVVATFMMCRTTHLIRHRYIAIARIQVGDVIVVIDNAVDAMNSESLL